MPQHNIAVDDPDDGAASPKELLQFGVRAVRQNILFSIFIALVAGAIGTTIVAALPETFDATCKIFMQDGGGVTGALASGRDHYRPIEGTRGLEELILSHDNLTSVVREAKLVSRWPSTRPWPMQLKDRAMEYLVGPPDPHFMERAFVEMLTLQVTAAKDGESVRIHGQWRDAEGAYDVTRLVERNFLAARAAHDHGPIQRAIPFLEQQLQEADQEMEVAVRRVQAIKSRVTGEPVVAPAPAAGAAPEARPNGASAAAVSDLSRRLSEIRRQQRALTEPRRHKVAELKMELIDLSSQYSADHPLIRQQEARIASLSEMPPELAELREEETKIIGALSSRGAKPENPTSPAKAAAAPVIDDPDLAAAQARLYSVLKKSDDVGAKLETARIELATAEADFKHRYVVVEEPEVPNAPLKPKKKTMFFALAVVASILIGMAAGILLELKRGHLVELWQVRQLGIDLLGEVDLK